MRQTASVRQMSLILAQLMSTGLSSTVNSWKTNKAVGETMAVVSQVKREKEDVIVAAEQDKTVVAAQMERHARTENVLTGHMGLMAQVQNVCKSVHEQ